MHLRSLILLITTAFLSFARAETLTNYSITPLALKGGTEVQWGPPEWEPAGEGVFKITLSGKAAPGTAVLLPNQKPSVVDPEGNFRLSMETKKIDVSIKVHFIATDGNVSTYLVKLASFSKGAAPQPEDDGSGLPKYKISSDYPLPLYFDLEGNGVKTLPPKLEYEIDPDGSLTLGNLPILDSSISFAVRRVADRLYAFEFRIPRMFSQPGVLEIQDSAGKPVWSEAMEISRMRVIEKDRSAGGEKDKPNEESEDEEPDDEYVEYFSTRMVRGKFDFLKYSDTFRFCYRARTEIYRSKVCSRRFFAREGTWFLRLIPTRKKVQDSVRINDVEVTSKGFATFDPNFAKMNVKIQLPGESILEFDTNSAPLDLRDIVLAEDGKAAWLAGRAPPPYGVETQLHPEGWRALLDLQEPHLYFPGKNGIPFRQDFEISRALPRERHRPYLHYRTPLSTYASSIDYDGELQDDYKVRSTELSAQNAENNLFEWDYQTADKGEFSKSHMLLSHKENEYSTYFETYRGYNFEFSTRLTGIVTSTGSLWLLGEIAGAAWMDSLFGWRNHYLTDRRWGVSARTFRSFISTENRAFDATNIELKYRLIPGLWNIDESVGLIGGYQAVNYQASAGSPTPAKMTGAGLFWARQMPGIFDDFFNIIPYFRYPKYVDMEAVYFVQSADPKVTLGAANFNVEFHGKMFFTPKYFLEASFGIRRLAYTNKDVNRQIEVTMLFGTGGLGINF